MELFDRVDEHDNVIGITNKKDSHELGHIHRVAAVYIFNPEGKMLVQVRKKDGLFEHSVGGHLRQGETYLEGAKREMFEELGLTNELTEIGIFYSDERSEVRHQKIMHHFGVYEAHTSNGDKLTTAPEEVESVVPMTMQEVATGMINEPEKYTLGFIKTFKFYASKKDIEIPEIRLV
ncbi:MAG: NUDIX domain-containing protein [Candidatus Pacebacteria bacterium]|nr:NUDIX domain-containing protein [Candidatus Paceibacterota bacterium]